MYLLAAVMSTMTLMIVTVMMLSECRRCTLSGDGVDEGSCDEADEVPRLSVQLRHSAAVV